MMRKYEVLVKFVFVENLEDENNSDSMRFEIEEITMQNAFYEGFKKVMRHFDEGAIAVTSIDVI